MNYKQTLDYLFTLLPMFQRVGKAAYKADLSNTFSLCKLLDNPENKFKSIHIAGTNGKGSVSHMLASVLQESGYKVGLYTSPHLKDFRERIKINGDVITENEVVSFVEKYKTGFEKINLSFFEWTVGLAFDYFAKQNVDIAVIETGLGGRLDSTNVIHPEISVITNIGLEHIQFLGDTLELIANEKAGIIKFQTPIIIGETQEETKRIFEEKASKMNAPICFADKECKKVYKTDLKGNYQQKNLKSAIMALQMLKNAGWKISDENLKNGLKNVIKNTGLLGRWQILGENPLIICDTGHNKEGIQEIVNQLVQIKCNNLHVVFGAVNDKSIDNMLDLLPKTARYYFCQAIIPRALDVKELVRMSNKRGLTGEGYKSVKDAFSSAKNNANEKDLIFIGGSTFVVAEIL